MKEKIAPWDVFEVLTTENRIRLYVDAAIEEAQNDTDSRSITRALATAAEARRRLAAKESAAPPEVLSAKDLSLADFDKAAREFGYRVTLAPVG